MRNYNSILFLVFIVMLISISCGGGGGTTPPVTDTTPPTWSGSEGIQSVDPNDGQLTIHWGTAVDPEGASVQYLLYIDIDDNPWDVSPIVVASNDPYTFTGLTNGVEYWLGVRCQDSNNPPNVDTNPFVLNATPAIPVNGPPEWDSTVGIQNVDPGDGELTIQWGTATDPQGDQVQYLLYIDTDDNPWDKNPIIRSNNNPYTFTGLTNGVEYWFGVRCQDGSDPPNVDTNNIVLKMTPAIADYVAPAWDTTVGITNIDVAGDEVTVHFGTATDTQNSPVSYLIYIGFDNNLWNRPPVVRTTNDPFTFTNLDGSIEYWFGVRCQDSYPKPNIDQNQVTLTTLTPCTSGDPSSPQLAGSLVELTSIRDFVIQDNFAYIIDGDTGLNIIDLSDPANLIILSSLDMMDNFADSIAIYGNYAYVGGRDLHVIDISNSSNPVEIGNYDFDISIFQVQNTLLFGCVDLNDFVIFDISDPMYPDLILNRSVTSNRQGSESNTYYILHNVTASENYALLTITENFYGVLTSTLVLYDISNPAIPESLSAISSDPSFRIEPLIRDNLVYYSTDFTGFIEILDISDPYNSGYVADIDYCFDALDFYEYCDFVYFLCYEDLYVADVSDPYNPTSHSSIAMSGTTSAGMKIQDNYLYLAYQSDGFHSIQLW